jgi:hypothetical protein
MSGRSSGRSSGSSSRRASGSAKKRPDYKGDLVRYNQQLADYYANKSSPPITNKMSIYDILIIIVLLGGVIAIIFAYMIPAFNKASSFTVNDDELKSKYHNKLT